MTNVLSGREREVLLAVLNDSLAADKLDELLGADATEVANTLVERGVLHCSHRGNYTVTSALRDRAVGLLGDDAPTVPVLEVLSSPRRRTHIEFFNGICDAETYAYMLKDGLHGAREEDRGVVSKIQCGDLLLGYVTEPYSEWLAVQRVTGSPFRTDPKLHGHSDLPFRVPAEFIVALRPGGGVGRLEAAEAAHVLGGKAAPHRKSPRRVDPVAGRVILKALMDAHGRKESVVPVSPLGPEYDHLLI